MDHWPSTLVVFLASLHVCHGLLQMPRWFGDNLVLQTNSQYGSRSFLNGKADPGECDTDASGNWEIQALGAGDVTVSTDKGEQLSATNVVGGDVYFCSGQ
eukprot:gene21314-33467_t